MSYGPNYPDLFRRAANFVDKILRGAMAADIPVEQPTKFDLVINLTTAKRRARSGRRGDRITDLLLRRGRPLVALRVISWRYSSSVAFDPKRTLSEQRLLNRIYEYAPWV
jgi:hypothetical protein